MKITKETFMKNFIKIFSIALLTVTFLTVDIHVTRGANYYLSQTALTLSKGSTKKLKLVHVPKAKKKKIQWSSTNKFAAKVTKKGKVKAVSYGTATIKAVYKKKTYTCAVVIPDTSRSVTLNTESITLQENTSYQLIASATLPVSYFSTNESILTVNAQGVIRAVNPGIAFVVAKSKTGYKRCTVTVTSADVQRPSAGWQLNRQTVGVRRLTKKGNTVYDHIVWAKGKTISFVVSGLNVNNIKKCTWSTSDKTILTDPKSNGNILQATAETKKEGTVTVTAKVTDTRGNVSTYTNEVYVSNPSVNTKNITLLGPGVGSNRQQFISLSGVSRYSDIEWSNSNEAIATLSPYRTKAALWGIQNGSGTITVTVDGKTIQVNYTVVNLSVNDTDKLLAQGKTRKLTVSENGSAVPVYSSRDTGIATVAQDGTVHGIKAGVTYIDIKIANMMLSYRIEVAAKGMKKIIKRAQYIVDNWTYSQARRMKKGYYDCSSLVWKGYKKYKNYHIRLGSKSRAYPAGELFDYLRGKKQIVYFGYTTIEDLKPGDLIFYGDYGNAVKYSTPGRTLDIYHVSMYAGSGKVVEKGGQSINYNNTNYIVGIGRVIE